MVGRKNEISVSKVQEQKAQSLETYLSLAGIRSNRDISAIKSNVTEATQTNPVLNVALK